MASLKRVRGRGRDEVIHPIPAAAGTTALAAVSVLRRDQSYAGSRAKWQALCCQDGAGIALGVLHVASPVDPSAKRIPRCIALECTSALVTLHTGARITVGSVLGWSLVRHASRRRRDFRCQLFGGPPESEPGRCWTPQVTRDWWEQRGRFELFVSAAVIAEASRGDSSAVRQRLALLDSMAVLTARVEAEALAASFITKRRCRARRQSTPSMWPLLRCTEWTSS